VGDAATGTAAGPLVAYLGSEGLLKNNGLAIEQGTKMGGRSILRVRGLRQSSGVEQRMQNSSFEVINLSRESAMVESYDNHPIAHINDHEVRISTMTEAYHWHCHPDSDESFLALEGGLFIDFDDRTVELLPGHMITVNRGVRHRTRPIGARSINLTFERAGARTEMLASPGE
jgi:mannose-6-phosphate isomerase-like protein (cupin superfamily)